MSSNLLSRMGSKFPIIALYASVSVVCSCVALTVLTCAYILFYFWFIPVQSFSIPIVIVNTARGDATGIVNLPRPHPNISYDIQLFLRFPDIPNLCERLGNITIEANIHGGDSHDESSSKNSNTKTLIARSLRPMIAPYQSGPVSLVVSSLRLIPVLMGLMNESVTQKVPIITALNFQRSILRSTSQVDLMVRLQSRDDVPLMESFVVIEAHFKGLRSLMYHWRYLFAFLTIGSIWLFCTLIIFVALVVSVWRVLDSPNDDVGSYPPNQTENSYTKKSYSELNDLKIFNDENRYFPSIMNDEAVVPVLDDFNHEVYDQGSSNFESSSFKNNLDTFQLLGEDIKTQIGASDDSIDRLRSSPHLSLDEMAQKNHHHSSLNEINSDVETNLISGVKFDVRNIVDEDDHISLISPLQSPDSVRRRNPINQPDIGDTNISE